MGEPTDLNLPPKLSVDKKSQSNRDLLFRKIHIIMMDVPFKNGA